MTVNLRRCGAPILKNIVQAHCLYVTFCKTYANKESFEIVSLILVSVNPISYSKWRGTIHVRFYLPVNIFCVQSGWAFVVIIMHCSRKPGASRCLPDVLTWWEKKCMYSVWSTTLHECQWLHFHKHKTIITNEDEYEDIGCFAGVRQDKLWERTGQPKGKWLPNTANKANLRFLSLWVHKSEPHKSREGEPDQTEIMSAWYNFLVSVGKRWLGWWSFQQDFYQTRATNLSANKPVQTNPKRPCFIKEHESWNSKPN